MLLYSNAMVHVFVCSQFQYKTVDSVSKDPTSVLVSVIGDNERWEILTEQLYKKWDIKSIFD